MSSGSAAVLAVPTPPRERAGFGGFIIIALPILFACLCLANKFGIGEVAEVPFGGNGGIFASDANEFHIKLKDGRMVNAGLLAGYYERNPPEKFPGLAEKLIRSQLGLV